MTVEVRCPFLIHAAVNYSASHAADRDHDRPHGSSSGFPAQRADRGLVRGPVGSRTAWRPLGTGRPAATFPSLIDAEIGAMYLLRALETCRGGALGSWYFTSLPQAFGIHDDIAPRRDKRSDRAAGCYWGRRG